jgi:hypothetical protein
VNFEEFLDKLDDTKDKIKWGFDLSFFKSKRFGLIRGRYNNNRLVCPITGLYNVVKDYNYIDSVGLSDVKEAGINLGLDEDLIEKISGAADNYEDCDKEIRVKLLEVLNLNEHAKHDQPRIV